MVELEYPHSQKLVVLGGGTGISTLLRGLVKINKPDRITALTGGWDDGSVSGRLRDERGVLPPGDYMQCIYALMESAKQQQAFMKIMGDRSEGDPLSHITASKAEKVYHGAQGGINGLRDLYGVRGKVILISENDVRLNSTTENGHVIKGEHNMDEIKNDPEFSKTDAISRIHFSTSADINPEARKALEEADKIIIAPGSPYTSIFPHLLVNEVTETILRSRAELIVALNLMTTKGEDHHLGLASHWLGVLQHYLEDEEFIVESGKSRIDYMVANENHLNPEILEIYRKEGQVPVVIDEEECIRLAPRLRLVKAKLARYDKRSHLLRHDPDKLAQTILELAYSNSPKELSTSGINS